jgi:dTDP-4-dehydrorhamnose reductase
MTTGISLQFEAQEPERVCIVGADGLLGRCLCNRYGGRTDPIFTFNHKELDITDELAVRSMIREIQPKVLINAAAYTNVDGCETNFDEAFQVNGEGPGNLARACERFDCKLIHISTDYVFDGKKNAPYVEDDTPNPINAYGDSKLLGENLVRVHHPKNHLIIRTSWLYAAHGNNFVTTVYSAAKTKNHLRIVNDQRGSLSFGNDLARAIEFLEKDADPGTYHFTNADECTWYDAARAIVCLLKRSDCCNVEPITTEELGRAAPRPAYSKLSTDKFEEAVGSRPRHWYDGLSHCVMQLERSK